MVRRSAHVASLLALTVALPSPAQGDVPFLTDDAAVVEPGHPEFSLQVDHYRLPAESRSIVTLSADVGIAEGLQLGVTAPAALASPPGTDVATGEVSARAKIALRAPGAQRVGVAFEPSVAIPLGHQLRRRPGFMAPIYIGLDRGPWSIYGGGGWAFNAAADGGDRPFAGLVAARALSRRVTVGAEIAGTGRSAGIPASLEVGPGVALALSDRVTLAAAVYRTMAHRSDNGDGRALVTLRLAR